MKFQSFMGKYVATAQIRDDTAIIALRTAKLWSEVLGRTTKNVVLASLKLTGYGC